jgi:hypothetical protein
LNYIFKKLVKKCRATGDHDIAGIMMVINTFRRPNFRNVISRQLPFFLPAHILKTTHSDYYCPVIWSIQTVSNPLWVFPHFSNSLDISKVELASDPIN